jgi:hypothetical protein
LVAPFIFLITRLQDRLENTVYNGTFVVVCLSVVAGTCLPKLCLETNVVSEQFASNGCFSDSTVHGSRKYANILWRNYISVFETRGSGIMSTVNIPGQCKIWPYKRQVKWGRKFTLSYIFVHCTHLRINTTAHELIFNHPSYANETIQLERTVFT